MPNIVLLGSIFIYVKFLRGIGCEASCWSE